MRSIVLSFDILSNEWYQGMYTVFWWYQKPINHGLWVSACIETKTAARLMSNSIFRNRNMHHSVVGSNSVHLDTKHQYKKQREESYSSRFEQLFMNYELSDKKWIHQKVILDGKSFLRRSWLFPNEDILRKATLRCLCFAFEGVLLYLARWVLLKWEWRKESSCTDLW